MKFFVEFTGKTISLHVEANDSIDTVKAQIETLENIPVHEQRIVFDFKRLEDGHLQDYGVKEQSTLCVVQPGMNIYIKMAKNGSHCVLKKSRRSKASREKSQL